MKSLLRYISLNFLISLVPVLVGFFLGYSSFGGALIYVVFLSQGILFYSYVVLDFGIYGNMYAVYIYFSVMVILYYLLFFIIHLLIWKKNMQIIGFFFTGVLVTLNIKLGYLALAMFFI